MKTLLFMLAGTSLLSFSASPAFADEYLCEAEVVGPGTKVSLGELTVDPDKTTDGRITLDADEKVFLTCSGTGKFPEPSPVESAILCGLVTDGQSLGWIPSTRALPQVIVKGPRSAVPHPSAVSTVVAKGTPMFALQVTYPEDAGDIIIGCGLKK